MKKVIVTGANGFIGGILCEKLVENGYEVVACIRKLLTNKSEFNLVTYLEIGDIRYFQDWENVLKDVDIVIHLANRAHIIKEKEINPLRIYREINVEVTENIIQAAIASNVKKFIFLSSIGVLGNKTIDEPFNEFSLPNPVEDYAVSKREAESMLIEKASESDIDLIIIRPPLVYGPTPKGNFDRLIKLAGKGLPLPFGSVKNKRSFVSVFNLIDLIIQCIDNPLAAGQTFLVSDGVDLATSELIKKIADATHKKVTIIPFPKTLLKILGNIIGKGGEVDRLCASLQVDISRTKELLDWTPPVSVEEGMRRTVDWYLNNGK